MKIERIFTIVIGLVVAATALPLAGVDVEQHLASVILGSPSPYRYLGSRRLGEGRTINSMAIDRLARRLISVDHESLEVFALETGERIARTESVAGMTLDFPAGVALDLTHQAIWVSDPGKNHVLILDAETLTLKGILGQSGQAGTDNAHFSGPGNIAFDHSRNRVVLSDTGNCRVQVFDLSTLAHLGTIGVAGQCGRDNAHLDHPHGVAVDEQSGHIFVVDLDNNRVQVFDAQSLGYVATIATPGAAGGNDRFQEPWDVAVDSGGRHLLVADYAKMRTFVFHLDSLEYQGSLVAGLVFPTAVAVVDGVAYVGGTWLSHSQERRLYVFGGHQ